MRGEWVSGRDWEARREVASTGGPIILAPLHRILPAGTEGAPGPSSILHPGVPGAPWSPPTKGRQEPAHLQVLTGSRGFHHYFKDQWIENQTRSGHPCSQRISTPAELVEVAWSQEQQAELWLCNSLTGSDDPARVTLKANKASLCLSFPICKMGTAAFEKQQQVAWMWGTINITGQEKLLLKVSY